MNKGCANEFSYGNFLLCVGIVKDQSLFRLSGVGPKKIPQSPTRIGYIRYHPGGETIQRIVDLPCQCGNAKVGSDI